MVDTKKRELNKLCKAYNNLYDFENSYYTQFFKNEDLEDIKSMNLRIQEIINKESYEIILNGRGNNYILRRIKR